MWHIDSFLYEYGQMIDSCCCVDASANHTHRNLIIVIILKQCIFRCKVAVLVVYKGVEPSICQRKVRSKCLGVSYLRPFFQNSQALCGRVTFCQTLGFFELICLSLYPWNDFVCSCCMKN